MLARLPELPEVESVRRTLDPVMSGARFEHVILRRPDLRTAFPKRFAARLTGQTVVTLYRRAKYLLADLSSRETLLMHLGMSGWFRIERDGARVPLERHDHVVFEMSSGASVIFSDPRRFGVMDLIAPGALATHPTLSKLGPEPLSAEFDAYALARKCRGRKTSLKVALLDQRVVAGLGNIYASEALHVARLSPNRMASTIATPSGAPRETAFRLVTAVKRVLDEAIERQTETSREYGSNERADRFRVYDRAGMRCGRRGCGGRIAARTQAGRTTFYCPRCQR